MPASSTARHSTSLPREREAKFVLARATDSAALAAILTQQGASFAPPTTVAHIDTYLDTPSFDLYRRGLSLRLRSKGDTRELGLKQVGDWHAAAIQERTDFSVPLDPAHTIDEPSAWPKAIVQALQPLVDKLAALHPVVELHQTRHKQTITTPDHGDSIAEWSVDRVEIHRPAPAPDAAPALDCFDELELELLDRAESAVFEAWVQALGAAPDMRPAPTSKFARSLHIVMQRRCDPTGPLPPSGYREYPLAEACRAILCDQLIAILSQEAGVRAGKDPEAVHAMRVAIRRARAALHLFGHCFRPKTLRRHTRGLKTLGRALGPVRDLDVTLASLDKYRKQMPRAERSQLQPLRKAVRARRRAAHAALIKQLDSDKHRTFITTFAAFCTTPGRGVQEPQAAAPEEILPTQVRHTLPSIIWRCFEQVRAYETALMVVELPPLATFHALRIQAKYLRYSLEFAAEMLGDPGSILITQLKAFQDHLGALNDAHVEQQRLETWAAEKWAAALIDKDVLADRAKTLEATQHELMATTPSKLVQVTSPHTRVLLGAALANI